MTCDEPSEFFTFFHFKIAFAEAIVSMMKVTVAKLKNININRINLSKICISIKENIFH